MSWDLSGDGSFDIFGDSDWLFSGDSLLDIVIDDALVLGGDGSWDLFSDSSSNIIVDDLLNELGGWDLLLLSHSSWDKGLFLSGLFTEDSSWGSDNVFVFFISLGHGNIGVLVFLSGDSSNLLFFLVGEWDLSGSRSLFLNNVLVWNIDGSLSWDSDVVNDGVIDDADIIGGVGRDVEIIRGSITGIEGDIIFRCDIRWVSTPV